MSNIGERTSSAEARRRSAHGFLDRLAGPDRTPAEDWIQVGGALLLTCTLAAALFWLRRLETYTTLQLMVALLLALDLVGGIITNATAAAKRWYHRPERTRGAHLLFVAAHAVHLVVLIVVFPFPFADALSLAVYVGSSAPLILWTPLYLRRAVAFTLFTGGLFLTLYVLKAPRGLEWFAPLFLVKLLLSYLLAEAPFTGPASRASESEDHALRP